MVSRKSSTSKALSASTKSKQAEPEHSLLSTKNIRYS